MYFSEPGKSNTEQTLALAYERGKALGLKEVVVATTSGDTAYQACEIFKGCKIIAVTYHCGFQGPFKKSMSDNTDDQIKVIQHDIYVVKDTVIDNVDKIVDNMRKTEDIEAKTQVLSEQSQLFNKRSSSLKWKYFCKNLKWHLIASTAIIICLIVIIIIIASSHNS